jgi:hypothetical protein
LRYAVHAVNTIVSVFTVNQNGDLEATAIPNRVDLLTLMQLTRIDLDNLRPTDPGNVPCSVVAESVLHCENVACCVEVACLSRCPAVDDMLSMVPQAERFFAIMARPEMAVILLSLDSDCM